MFTQLNYWNLRVSGTLLLNVWYLGDYFASDEEKVYFETLIAYISYEVEWKNKFIVNRNVCNIVDFFPDQSTENTNLAAET